MQAMITILGVVAPVFAIIALGYFSARTGLVSEHIGRLISRFVFTVAIPAMLFRTMATISAPAASPWALWASYFGGAAISGAVAVFVVRSVFKRRSDEASVVGLGSGYSNTVLLGLPLVFSFLGETEAAVPLFIILSVNLLVMTVVGTLFVEWTSSKAHDKLASHLWQALRALITNPIIIGLVAGLTYRTTGLGLAEPIEWVLSWLSWIAIPSALFAMGLALNRFGFTGDVPACATILACKLVLHPAIVWFLSSVVFGLPPIWVAVAVLFAAAPTGINVFLFASRYGIALPAVSAAITLGTALSALTISFAAWALGLHLL